MRETLLHYWSLIFLKQKTLLYGSDQCIFVVIWLQLIETGPNSWLTQIWLRLDRFQWGLCCEIFSWSQILCKRPSICSCSSYLLLWTFRKTAPYSCTLACKICKKPLLGSGFQIDYYVLLGLFEAHFEKYEDFVAYIIMSFLKGAENLKKVNEHYKFCLLAWFQVKALNDSNFAFWVFCCFYWNCVCFYFLLSDP